MKKICKSITIIVLAIFCITMINVNYLYASSISVGASNTSINVGASTTVTVSGSDVTGRINVSVSDSSVLSVNASSVWVENGSASVTVSGKKAGSATVTFTPSDISNSAGDDITLGAKSVTITVKAPVNNNNNNNNNNSNNNKAVNNVNNSLSNNANIKSLYIDQEGLSPMFSSVVTNYTLTVPEKVTSLKITPTLAQAGAKYWITGDEDLKMGNNVVTITVTAPDGTKKTYTINVNRVEDTEKSDVALKSLIIDGVEMKPEFAPDTLEYDLGQFDSSIKKLTILAFANSDKAKVEIIGNSDFKEGDNLIKIIVTAEDGKTTREYKLKFKMDKAPVEQIKEEDPYQEVYEEPSRLENFINNAKKNKLLLIVLFVAIIELIEIIVLYRRLYRKENDDFNDKYNIPLYDLDNKEESKDNIKRRRSNVDKTENITNDENIDNNTSNLLNLENINNNDSSESEQNELTFESLVEETIAENDNEDKDLENNNEEAEDGKNNQNMAEGIKVDFDEIKKKDMNDFRFY